MYVTERFGLPVELVFRHKATLLISIRCTHSNFFAIQEIIQRRKSFYFLFWCSELFWPKKGLTLRVSTCENIGTLGLTQVRLVIVNRMKMIRGFHFWALTLLRDQSFDNCLKDEPWVGTPTHRSLNPTYLRIYHLLLLVYSYF